MKIKNHGLLLLAAALIMSLMSGCGQEDDRTYLPGDSGAGEAASAGTGSASSPEAGSEALDESLSLLTDIATTQYFTDEAVDSGDIENNPQRGNKRAQRDERAELALQRNFRQGAADANRRGHVVRGFRRDRGVG